MRTFDLRSCAQMAALALCCLQGGETWADDQSVTPPESKAISPARELAEVIVTARRREEKLQDVPDAITAFTNTTIVNAGIEQMSDFAALTPNMTFSDASAFRPGGFVLSMRGIGNSQLGWPSVSYIVDGIPADSQDTMSIGSLVDIDRIEVLRGPQSALYGFNAIAGAINIVTKAPTQDWSYDTRLLYGNGNDRRADGIVSGPIISEKLLFRIGVSYLDNDGVIRSTSNGIDLDFQRHDQVQGRLLFTPTENLKFDLHGDYIDEHDGAVYQDEVPIADSNNWDVFGARRAFPGEERRDLSRAALRIQWDLPSVSLISATAFSNINQTTFSSYCYDDPNDPLFPAVGGGDQCWLGNGIVYGNAAKAGQPIDEYYYAIDNRRSWTEDLRIQSRGGRTIDWAVGASALHRVAVDGFDVGNILAPDRSIMPIFPGWYGETDNWWAIYGQVTWNVTDRLQLTAAGRYDDEKYQAIQWTDDSRSVIVPAVSPSGALENTQNATGDAFQPKGSLSYKFTPDFMVYTTISRGFRAAFYNSAALTLPEHTTNYELGLKSTLGDRRATINVAAFHIDYENQQSTQYITTFPYVVSTNIPKTNINGVEVEANILASDSVTFSTSFGYLHAPVSDGTTSPLSPTFNASGSIDFKHAINSRWAGLLHGDVRFNTLQYLQSGNMQEIPSTVFLNFRAGIKDEHYTISAFVKNATNQRTSEFGGGAGPLPSGEFVYDRSQNTPRTYGIEFRAGF
jgi:iron complex outermembrane receptor protein